MFSLQKLLGKDDKFFRLMEGSAEEARTSIRSLSAMLKATDTQRSIEALAEARRNEKRITQEHSEHLSRTFVTPLEREDIQALAEALYKIPKTIEKFSERYLFAGEHVRNMSLAKQMPMLEKAGDTVVSLVNELRKGVNLEKVKAQNDQLQKIEGDADNLMLEVLRDLYNGDHSAMRVIVLKDLYELLEKAFDRCRDVGNIVFHIVLKHS